MSYLLTQLFEQTLAVRKNSYFVAYFYGWYFKSMKRGRLFSQTLYFYRTTVIEDYKTELIKIKNSEKDYLLIGILRARSRYPFFKENGKIKELKAFKENARGVADMLKSDNFETFYKVFPAKDFGTTIKERQNLSKVELAKTTWFKSQIEKLIN